MNSFRKFAVRDGALLTLTVMGWVLLLNFSAGNTVFSEFVAVMLGVAGGMCAWVLHEWGHWVAARSVRANLRAASTIKSVYLFGFDNKRHSKLQFVVMALGGFAATAAVFAFILLGLPQDMLATKVLRSLVMLEILVTIILEVPGLLLGIFAYSRLPSVDVLGE